MGKRRKKIQNKPGNGTQNAENRRMISPYDDRVNHEELLSLARKFEKQQQRMQGRRGFNIDTFSNASWSGVLNKSLDIPNKYLRMIEGKNPVVAAGFNLRIQQVPKYMKPSNNPDVPGYRVRLEDEDRKPTKKEQNEMREIERWFRYAGRTDFPHWRRERPEGLLTIAKKFIRERMTIDEVALEVCKTYNGGPGQFFIYDADTIKPVLPGGYRGTKEEINPHFYMVGDAFYQKLAESRLEDIPPLEDIAYVQELNGRLVAAWTEDEFIYDIANPRSDIRFYKQGWSVLERANSAIVAFIYSLKYNINGLDTSAIPKLAIALGQNAEASDEMIEAFQDEWETNFSGIQGQWRIPILRADAKILDVFKTNRDMEYMKFAEMVAAITLSVMGIDPAELGLRLNQAQSVLNENDGNKQLFSRDRGLHDLLGQFENICNTIMNRFPEWEQYVFEFTGLNPEDKAAKSKLRKEAVETYKTINTILAEEDQPADPYGDIILNPQYLQYRMHKEQQEQQAMMGDTGDGYAGGGEGGPDEDEDTTGDIDIDSLIDEEMEKAEPRTMLV